VVDPVQLGLSFQPLSRLSLASSLAVCHVLSEHAPDRDCGIKWPNDVYLDGSKICGLLVETANSSAGVGTRTVVGVGINVNNSVRCAPPEIAQPITSLIDEMGTEQEAAAARTIAERGVQLVATAHGNTLDNLILNPTLSDLIGGIQSVTLGDQEARYRGTQKTVLERKAPPTFDVVIEINNWNEVAINNDVSHVVDQWLRGYPIIPEVRYLDENGEVKQNQETRQQGEGGTAAWQVSHPNKTQSKQSHSLFEEIETEDADGINRNIDARVFLFGVSRDKLEGAQSEVGLTINIANELRQATHVLTTKNHYRRGANLVKIAESSGTPVFVLRKNTMPQVADFLRTLAKQQGLEESLIRPPRFNSSEVKINLDEAMQEAEEAAEKILQGEFSIQLTPQRAYVRRLQHILAQRFNLASTSRGKDPSRSVLIYRP